MRLQHCLPQELLPFTTEHFRSVVYKLLYQVTLVLDTSDCLTSLTGSYLYYTAIAWLCSSAYIKPFCLPCITASATGLSSHYTHLI